MFIYMFTLIFQNIESLSGKEIKKLKKQWVLQAEENFSCAIFDMGAILSVALV